MSVCLWNVIIHQILDVGYWQSFKALTIYIFHVLQGSIQGTEQNWICVLLEHRFNKNMLNDTDLSDFLIYYTSLLEQSILLYLMPNTGNLVNNGNNRRTNQERVATRSISSDYVISWIKVHEPNPDCWVKVIQSKPGLISTVAFTFMCMEQKTINGP